MFVNVTPCKNWQLKVFENYHLFRSLAQLKLSADTKTLELAPNWGPSLS